MSFVADSTADPAALVTLSNPAVTIVYCEPAKEVTAVAAPSAPDCARVIAEPALSVTTVYTDPPIAEKDRSTRM